MRLVSLLALTGLILAACAASPDVASRDNQVSTQTSSVSDADYDKYVDGMIESDAEPAQPTATN